MKLKMNLAAATLLLSCACEPDDWGPDRLGGGHMDAKLEQLRLGQKVYGDYCAGCHGNDGKGAGQAARFLSPKPRDFSVGRIKFAAVEAGQSPRDEDYLRIIDGGLQGTAMPSFRLLPTQEKQALIAYLKSFYPDWGEDPPGNPVNAGQDPWASDVAGGIAAGRAAYYGVAKCWSCHPAYETRAEIAKLTAVDGQPPPDLRANLYESETKESNWGTPLRAPDFGVDRIKTGFEVASIARVIASGVGGTAMPTWAGALEPEQIWGLAYYVHDLALQRGTPKAKAHREALLKEGN